MKKTLGLLLSILLPLLLLAGTSHAAVTLAFNSTTEGFTATGNPGTFAWSPTNGGSLKLSAPGNVWQGDIAALSLESTALWSELQAAALHGGTLSFDFIVVGTSQAYPANPGWFKASVIGNSPAGWLNNALDTGLQWNQWPLNPNQRVFHFTLPIATNGAAGDGRFVVNLSQGWAKLELGLNTDSAMTTATAFIDNLTIAANAPATITHPPAGYSLVWADEFDGSTLDPTKWGQEFPGARRDAVNVTNAVSVTNGLLTITTYTQNGTNYTGMISTYNKFTPRYGYMEARIDFDSQPGMWSAFWMYNRNVTTVGDPHNNGTEMDIIEHRARDAANADISSQGQSAIHWDGYGAQHKTVNSGLRGAGLANGFHRYAVEWTPDFQKYYIDGTNVWTVTNSTATDPVPPAVPVSHATEYFVLSSEVQNAFWAGNVPGGGYGSLASSTAKMKVDYVRCYQIGAPAPAPKISQFNLTGGNIILQGTNNNGTAPGTYRILTATNVATPLSSWVTLTNGSFDVTGQFASTNVAGPSLQRFYILQIP